MGRTGGLWFRVAGVVLVTILVGLVAANHWLVLLHLPEHSAHHNAPVGKGTSAKEGECPLSPECPHLACKDQQGTHFQVVPPPFVAPHRISGGTSRRNLILGMATHNIELDRIAVFVRSARRAVAPSTTIMILTDVYANGTRAELFEELGVQETVALVADDVASKYHPNSHRWVLLRDFLRAQKVPYDAVLFTDVRDVVFQSDPFALMTGPNSSSLFTFREASPARRGEDGTIGTEQRNKGWVLKCFGEEGLKLIQHNIVSCAGVTMGGWSASQAYLSLMVETILSKSSCIDQGVHNYLVYGGKLATAIAPSSLVVVPLEQGVVAQVQSMPPQSVVRNKIGQVVAPDGAPFAIVHQYDRSKHRFQPQLLKQYHLLALSREP